MTNQASWHPLLTKDLRTMKWAEWKERWNKACTREDMVGLLHEGFNIEDAPPVERVCLYMDIADSYQFSELTLDAEKGTYSQTDWTKVRREVAQKAFKMLVNRFFSNTAKVNRYQERLQWHSWTTLAATKPVLEKILWFFRNGNGYTGCPPNLPGPDFDKHSIEVIPQFLDDFVDFIWRFEGFGQLEYPNHEPAPRASVEEEDKCVREVVESRPRVLTLMSETNRLWYFLYHPDAMDLLDQACQKTLKEIALRPEWYSKKSYETLEESWVVGRRLAGMILVLLPIYQKEVKRQQALEEAEQLQKKAEWLRREAGRQ